MSDWSVIQTLVNRLARGEDVVVSYAEMQSLREYLGQNWKSKLGFKIRSSAPRWRTAQQNWIHKSNSGKCGPDPAVIYGYIGVKHPDLREKLANDWSGPR